MTKAKYEITIKTGDRKKAGTDADVHIILYDDLGRNTKAFNLDNRFHDDFERGQTDVFKIQDPIDLRHVAKIEFWRDDKGFFADWFVDTIDVRNLAYPTEVFVFPIYRWIQAFYHYKVFHLDTFLPQNDPHQKQRQMELDEKQKVYVLKQKVKGLVAQVKTVSEMVKRQGQYGFRYGFRIMYQDNTLWLRNTAVEYVFSSIPGDSIFNAVSVEICDIISH